MIKRQQIEIAISILLLLLFVNYPNFAMTPFPYASIRSDCGLWGGAAVTIRLSQQPDHCQFNQFPAIDVRLWTSREQLQKNAPVSYTLTPETQNSQGIVVLCDQPNHCRYAQSSQIHIERVSQSGIAIGTYTIQIDGKILQGQFKTEKWCNSEPLCR
jgi:hypothetical protein